MGCGSSTEANVDNGGARPSRARPAHTRPDQSVRLQTLRASSAGGSQQNLNRTNIPMTENIRTEFLHAAHEAFGGMQYAVIGGAALAEYGNKRATSDLDVMIPEDISSVVEDHLLSHGMVRTAGGGLGYIATDRRCYGLDITTDRAVSQRLSRDPNSQQISKSGAHLMSISLLLNSKAWSYLTRVGPDRQTKKANDAQDIIFITSYMKRHKIRPSRQECRWVVDYDFWTTFCSDYQGTEATFRELGLNRDSTPSSSNRQSRGSSMSIRSMNSRSSSRN